MLLQLFKVCLKSNFEYNIRSINNYNSESRRVVSRELDVKISL